ncbi:MAG: hypothetical protein Q8P10_03570, partial [bacterium]|nr:hypothetical protein [bacterium]
VGSSTIVQAASGISQQLSLGIDICARNYPPTNNRCYDAKPNEGITGDGTNNNTYWCTFLIVDSYSNTGSGLSRSAQGAVFNMKAFFQNQSQNGGKLKFLPADTSVQSLFPGDVIFFEGSGQHVSLIKSIDIDSNGDGAIHTYDSNNIVLEDTVTVKSYNVISAWSTSSIYSITGFGHLL